MPSFAFCLLLFERVDGLNGREEADFAAVMLDGLHAEGGGNMGFSSAGAADQDNVLCAVHELTAMKLPYSGLVDLTGREVETGEVLVSWEACGLHVIGTGPDLTYGSILNGNYPTGWVTSEWKSIPLGDYWHAANAQSAQLLIGECLTSAPMGPNTSFSHSSPRAAISAAAAGPWHPVTTAVWDRGHRGAGLMQFARPALAPPLSGRIHSTVDSVLHHALF